MNESRHPLSPGTTLYDIDGEHLGTITGVEDAHIVVDQGVFRAEARIPVEAIGSTRDGSAHLAIRKDEALRQGWDGSAPEPSPPDQVADTGSGYSAVQAEDSLDDDRATMPVQDDSPSPLA